MFDSISGILATSGSATPILTGIAAGWIVIAVLMAWKRLAGVAAGGLMGLGVSIYLGLQHHAAAGASACSVSETFNCDVVNRSAYSEVFGIPIAFLGTGFYAALIGGAVLALMKPQDYKRVGHLALVGGVVSVAYSAFLAWASVQLGAWCLFCISLYGVNALITTGGWLEARADTETPIGDGIKQGLLGKDDRSSGAMMTAGLAVFIGVMAWYNNAHDAPAEAQAAPKDLTTLYQATAAPVELDGTEPVLGSPDAPYTLVEFADFECPYCGKVAPEMHELVHDFPEIKVLFKHYPISGLCNDQVEGVRHENSCQAAAASECARQQGKFWEMNGKMFKNQGYLGKDDLRFMADQLQLDKETFETCMGDPRTESAVRADVAAAVKVGVNGTPSLFLNGLEGEDWVKLKGGPQELAMLLTALNTGKTVEPGR